MKIDRERNTKSYYQILEQQHKNKINQDNFGNNKQRSKEKLIMLHSPQIQQLLVVKAGVAITAIILLLLVSTITVGGTNTTTMIGKSCHNYDYDSNTEYIDAHYYTQTHLCSSDGSEYENGFCGTDNICHTNNCRNFFLYMPEQLTGRTATDSAADELVCNPYDVCSANTNSAIATPLNTTTMYSGVSYGCDYVGTSFVGKCDTDNDVVNRLVNLRFDSLDDNEYLPFNEKCTYQNKNIKNEWGEVSSFNCYQYAVDTNFDLFLSRVDNFTNLCDLFLSRAYVGDFDHICKRNDPVFEYTASYSHSSSGVTFARGVRNGIIVDPAVATTFNRTLAIQSTMYATIQTDASWSYSIHNNKMQHWNPIIVPSVLLVLFFSLF